ncbi:MAG: F0F1 ATP synthase subunit epsilon [Dehalococcoidales bacterium]|nr:F0F1 ATP synthase subunit epsilon [Dehalococcoidales bacterium]
MPSLKVEIVTAERVVYSGEVEAVIAPGTEGQLGILPHHAPLMTSLAPGELVVRTDGQEEVLAISGGFIEVRPDRVIVLADQAERADEIDLERAEAAMKRAKERLGKPDLDTARTEAALRRAMVRLNVAEKIKTRRRR